LPSWERKGGSTNEKVLRRVGKTPRKCRKKKKTPVMPAKKTNQKTGGEFLKRLEKRSGKRREERISCRWSCNLGATYLGNFAKGGCDREQI